MPPVTPNALPNGARPRLVLRATPLFLVAALASVAALPLVVAAPFYLNMAILIFVYIALGQAWNLLAGFAGQISLGQHVFFGVGAYGSALLLTWFDLSPWIGIPASAALAALIGLAIGWPTFKLSRHYFSIATLLLGAIAAAVMVNAYWAGGAAGIYLPYRGESVANFQFGSRVPFYYIALGIAIASTLIVIRITRSPVGHFLRSIRDDPDAAAMIGVDVQAHKLYAMAWHAALTAVAGGFMALYVSYIDPGSAFNLQVSILTILAVVIGGVGTIAGPIVGVLIMIPLSEFTRSILGSSANGLHQVAFGLLAVALGVGQPYGLVHLAKKARARWRRGS